jgi:hypothetical protein
VRPILLGMLFAASCAASPVPQAAPDAEALYRKMEAALTGAKKLTVDFTATADGASVKGTFTFDEGNKLDMSVEGTVGVKKYKLALKCDGEKLSLTRSETPAPPVPLEEQPVLPGPPPKLSAHTALALARGGAWLAQEFADGEYRAIADAYFVERQKAREQNNRPMKPQVVAPRDIAALHELRNFRSGDGGSVRYDLVPTGENPPVRATITVWVDAKGMPKKREGQFFTVMDGKPSGEALSKWSDTYTYR